MGHVGVTVGVREKRERHFRQRNEMRSDSLRLEVSTRQEVLGGKAGWGTHACIHIQSIGQKKLRLLCDESFALEVRALPAFCPLFCLSSSPHGDLILSTSNSRRCQKTSRSPY